MNDFQQSIPISRRIQAVFMAMLVTIVVICVFPLLESLSPIHPAPTPQPVAFPVKLATTTTQPFSTPQYQSKPTTPPRSMKMAAMTLPKPLTPPPQTPIVTLPPKPLPVPVKTVDITPQPTVQPQPINEPIPQQAETSALETTASATENGNRTNAPSLVEESDGTLPDGKSLKFPPNFLNHPAPTYPEYARRRGIEGFVILHFIVDINGRVVEPSVLQANPQGYFETAALRTIKQWRFSPGRNDNGTPVPCRLQMRIDFILKDSNSHGQYIRLQSSAS
ncbi:MAG: TonB family protein [Victivallales bacterium]|nr:TonB family protein [Victivallales bacterium]